MKLLFVFIVLLNSIIITLCFNFYGYDYGSRFGRGFAGNGGLGIRTDGQTLSDFYGVRSRGLMTLFRPYVDPTFF